VPHRNQQVNDWLGMGWIVADLNTGAAGYFIAGSVTAGGSTSLRADVSLFNEEAVKAEAFIKLLAAMAILLTGGAVFARAGLVFIVQALVGGGAILGLAGALVLAVGIVMIAIAIGIGIFLLPEILAAGLSRKRRWFAFHWILVSST